MKYYNPIRECNLFTARLEVEFYEKKLLEQTSEFFRMNYEDIFELVSSSIIFIKKRDV
jgi:hypothetical protein